MCEFNMKHVVLYVGHLYKLFWTHWLTDSLIDCLTDSCDMTWKQLLWRPWVPWTLGSNVPLVMFSINGQIMNFCVWADWICHFISAFLILCCVILLFLYYLVPATRSISIFGMQMVGQKSLGRVGYRDLVRAWTQKRLQSHTALGGRGPGTATEFVI